MKPLKHRLKKWFATRPALRFSLALAGPLAGRYMPEYFWPGVALLTAGSLLHLWAKGCLRQNEALTTCGPYRRVRHPFYLAYLIIDAGLCLMIANPYLALVYFPGWFLIYVLQIRLEERNLTALFGQEYAAYRRRVPALIPYGPHAPRPRGQGFSWSNPNLTRRSEIARLLRLTIFPLFFFLAYRIRDAGMSYLDAADRIDAFAVSALLAVFFFSKLLTPAIRRQRRMLPRWLEHPLVAIVVAVSIAAIARYTCNLGGSYLPLEYWYLWIFALVLLGAGWLAFLSKKFVPYLSVMLFCITVAVAYYNFWLVPVAVFYNGACMVDRVLFPHRRDAEKLRSNAEEKQ